MIKIIILGLLAFARRSGGSSMKDGGRNGLHVHIRHYFGIYNRRRML